MGRRDRKERARRLLRSRDLDGLAAWSREEPRAGSTLVSLLYETDPLPRWRAVEGLGRIVGVFAAEDPEKVREILRRLLWSMNDESGGLVRHAPEAIGEILVNAPALLPEYAALLPSFFVEEPFEQGAQWAVARLAGIAPDLFSGRAPEALPFLEDPDPFVRAHAGVTLARVLKTEGEERASKLLGDEGALETYDIHRGELVKVTVAGLVRGRDDYI